MVGKFLVLIIYSFRMCFIRRLLFCICIRGVAVIGGLVIYLLFSLELGRVFRFGRGLEVGG